MPCPKRLCAPPHYMSSKAIWTDIGTTILLSLIHINNSRDDVDGHVVRRDDESILKKATMFEVNGPRKRGRPKQTWKKQVEENIKKIGLRVEEATDRARWREGVGAIAEGMNCIRPPLDTRKNRIKTG